MCLLLWGEFDLDFFHNGPDQFGLKRQYVSQIAFIAVGPDVRIGGCLYELCGHANSATRALNRALNDLTDSPLSRDLRQWTVDPLIVHRGRARYHPQSADPGKLRDQ